jgi:hypothetical protein
LIQRFVEALSVLRPRAVARTHKGVDDLRVELAEVRNELQGISGSIRDLRQDEGFAFLREQRALLDEIRADVKRIEMRETQLRAIALRDVELEDREDALARLMCDDEVRSHVWRQFEAATLRTDPFPHLVVDRVLPDKLYDAVVAGIPPVELFFDRRPNKRQMTVPFKLAPAYGRRIWNYMARVVVPQMIMPEMVRKFREPLSDWLRQNFPALGDSPLDRLRMTASDGRILLRTRGYVIPPHRDPKWGFLTGLLYLARPGDSETWGTQLYSVDEDREARGVAPYWIDGKKCRQVVDVTFVPNRILIFINSAGAHGATIPDDAEPEALERYAYQFRIGLGEEATNWVLDTLSPERRPFWMGKTTDY